MFLKENDNMTFDLEPVHQDKIDFHFFLILNVKTLVGFC